MSTKENPTRAAKPPISTHILDTTKGLPAAEVPVSLLKLSGPAWTLIKSSKTNSDGRCDDFIETGSPIFTPGRYKLSFEVDKYFLATNTRAIYPTVEVIVDIENSATTYHLPLLLNPFGYSTYRGS